MHIYAQFCLDALDNAEFVCACLHSSCPAEDVCQLSRRVHKILLGGVGATQVFGAAVIVGFFQSLLPEPCPKPAQQ